MKDKDGDPPTTTEEQLKRWAEQFRELLNCPAPETPPDIPPTETELPISCDKPTKAEIKKAIMTLRGVKKFWARRRPNTRNRSLLTPSRS